MIAQKNFPLFIVAGMPRGGTTFLYHNLNKHPYIFLPFRKEVNYFNVNLDKGLDWYLSLYKDRQPEQICGDISPPCFLDWDSIDRINEFNPNAKLIISVRDPVEWALSLYSQFSSFTFNMPEFNEYLNGFNYKITDKSLLFQFKNDYIIKTLQKFMDSFGDRALLYDFNYFRKDTLKILKVIEEFLEIPAFFESRNYDDVKINASDRRNIRLLTYWLSNATVIELIEKVFPRKLVIYLRGKFDRVSVPKNKQEKGVDKLSLYTEEQKAMVTEVLSDQSKKVKEIFVKGPVILGAGSSYSP